VLSGSGTVTAEGHELAIDGIGAYPLLEHERHTEGVLDLVVGTGVDGEPELRRLLAALDETELRPPRARA
jgi:hypothetical protein